MFSLRIDSNAWLARLAPAALGILTAMPFLTSARADAATIYVSPSGDDGNLGTSAEVPVRTIIAAIDSAVTGDTIMLEDGTYSGSGNYNVDTGRKTLTITSQHGAASTIIDCQLLGPALILQNAGERDDTPTKLANITIQNASLGTGHGAVYALGPGAEIDDCVFKDNDSVALATGFLTTLRVNRCAFKSNNYSAIIIETGSTMQVDMCAFSKNLGGGIINIQGSVDVTNSTFSENSGGDASGISCTSFSNVSVANCVFSGNTGYFAGALYSDTYTYMDIRNSDFRDNSSIYGSGAVNYVGASLYMMQCNFFGNTGGGNGGAVYTAGTSDFDSCLFSGNSSKGDGGAIYNEAPFTEIAEDSTTQVDNCAFFANRAEGGSGGGIANYGSGLVEGSTFTGNRAATAGGAIAGSVTTLVDDILWGDTAPLVPEVDAAAPASYSDIQSGHSGVGNIRRDPQFINPATGDLHLKPSSPCIGTGTIFVGTGFDIEGDQRPVAYGMGAYDSVKNLPAVVTSFEPLTGPVGTLVTIHGSYLAGVSAIKFNGIATTSFSLVSPNEITVLVPMYASTGQISVKKQYSTSSSTGVFTVPAVPPTITGFAPSTGLVGSHVRITGTNFKDVSAVAFNGTSASFQVLTSTSIDAIVPPGAVSGMISVTTPAGTAYSKGSFVVKSS